MRKQDFLERVIRRFIPPPILYVCEAEESGWFAEIGRVAVIFVNIAIRGLPGMNVMQSVFFVRSTREGDGAGAGGRGSLVLPAMITFCSAEEYAYVFASVSHTV